MLLTNYLSPSCSPTHHLFQRRRTHGKPFQMRPGSGKVLDGPNLCPKAGSSMRQQLGPVAALKGGLLRDIKGLL